MSGDHNQYQKPDTNAEAVKFGEIKISAAIESWFPTEIFICQAPQFLNHTRDIFNNLNFDAMKSEKYLNGFTTYFNQHNVPEMQKQNIHIFGNSIQPVVAFFAETQGVDVEKTPPLLTSIWLSRIQKNGAHAAHAHGGAHYSGTYYVNVSEDTAKIRFHNPIADLWGLAMPSVVVEGKHQTSMYVDYQPKPGDLFLWNSWLYHEVLVSETDKNRDSISFNFVC